LTKPPTPSTSIASKCGIFEEGYCNGEESREIVGCWFGKLEAADKETTVASAMFPKFYLIQPNFLFAKQ